MRKTEQKITSMQRIEKRSPLRNQQAGMLISRAAFLKNASENLSMFRYI